MEVEIHTKRPEAVELGSLKPGDVFVFLNSLSGDWKLDPESTPFMRIDGNHFVSLKDGRATMIGQESGTTPPGAYVVPIHGKIVITKIGGGS